MPKRTRFQELQDAAAESGLYVATWSPGDGVTRYRFFDRSGNSYFGPDNGIATKLGMKKAWEFVYAYGAGQPHRDPPKPKKKKARRDPASRGTNPSKPKRQRYRMPYKQKTSFHRLGEGIIGRTTGSELHLASAEGWREQAAKAEDARTRKEFLSRARAHEKRASSKGMQQSHRRVLEGELWKIWPKEYKYPASAGSRRFIRMKTREGYEDRELQDLTDEEIMHLLHPARRDPGSRRGSTVLITRKKYKSTNGVKVKKTKYRIKSRDPASGGASLRITRAQQGALLALANPSERRFAHGTLSTMLALQKKGFVDVNNRQWVLTGLGYEAIKRREKLA